MYLWGVQQHTGQFIAGVWLHVRITETPHLICGSQMEILENKYRFLAAKHKMIFTVL